MITLYGRWSVEYRYPRGWELMEGRAHRGFYATQEEAIKAIGELE